MIDDPLVDHPFSYHETKDDRVRLSHHGRLVSTLRGDVAERFMDGLDEAGRQQRMGRVTGQFRFGNERQAQRHPRNR